MLLFKDEDMHFKLDFSSNSVLIKTMSDYQKRKLKVDNLHLSSNMEYEGDFDIPIVKPYRGEAPDFLLPYNMAMGCETNHVGIHMYIHDCLFSNLWDKLERQTLKLARFDLLVGPDYSLYMNRSKAINVMNVYKNRFISAYWQQCGLNVVPSCSWANVDSFRFCFDGLPTHSIISIGTEAGLNNRFEKKLFIKAVEELFKKKSPVGLMVYGKDSMNDFLYQFNVPIYYYPGFVKHLKNICNGKKAM